MAITEKDKAFFLSIKPADITDDIIIDLFADKAKKDKDGKMKVVPSRYKTNEVMILAPNEYFNKERVVTNLGLFMYNKLIVERDLIDVLGYINTPINKKMQGTIEDKLSNALLNDRMTSKQYADYLNRNQWLSMQFNSIFSGSFTMKTIKPSKTVTKKRDDLYKENREKLNNGDVITAVRIETELKTMARTELENDPGMDLYDSGARGSFDNNYKNIAITKGPVINPTTGKWDIVESSFMEGIKKKDIPVFGNAVVSGAYPKAVGTQVSGYLTKQLTAAFQGIVLDGPGSDCGTKGTLDILLTPWLVQDLLYSFIVDGGKLVLLDDKTIKKYVGKKVKLRFPMFCISEKLCRTCAGLMFEKLGLENIGLTTSKVSTRLLNLNMKKFHVTTANIKTIDILTLSL